MNSLMLLGRSTKALNIPVFKTKYWFARAIKPMAKKVPIASTPKKEIAEEQEDNEPRIETMTLKSIKYKEDFDENDSNELIEQNKEEEETEPALPDDYIKENKEAIKFVQERLLYTGYDPFPEKLVQRPEKDVVWGLGGELLKRKQKIFEKYRMPTIEEIIYYLEMEQAKDINLVDLVELGRKDLGKYAIILTAYSSKHMYKMAQNLVKALKEIEIPDLPNPPDLSGRRDDEWILVSCKDYLIHMFLEDARKEIDLEWKWRNPPTDAEVLEFEKIAIMRNKTKLLERFEKKE